jgi:hypothetical protein
VKDTFIEVITRATLASLDEGRQLMALIEKTAPDWLPGKWGHWEPLRRDYEASQLEEAWSDNLLWKGRAARVDGSVWRPEGPHRRYGIIHLTCDPSASLGDRAVHAAQDMALAFEGIYGFVHVLGKRTDGDPPHLFVSQFDLRGGLPDVYWGNLLGEPFVRLYGADRIASAPAYLVDQLGPELFWVQLTERLDDARSAPELVAEASAAVKEHLGAGVPGELAAMTAPGE